ncbi:hypothetical protein [Actinoplanes siamensis]|uniref:Uncharacterized protein n=1 Tax=Actinoplanes siamensis TaxID=1223317 RepID=A0A919NB77_9ACTN|nr:hypothetical protein [Actinoplanes siamensis]GIF07574.1 hypothetical protein Asi03nite_51120 [Actinoplanes siamensis]
MKNILRPLVTAYASLPVLLPAAGLPWPALLPACLLAFLAIGELWIRAVTGRSAEVGPPAVRAGLVVLAGLLTLPAVALLLHPFGAPVAPVPLIAASALLATVLAVAGLLRLRLRRRDGDAGLDDGAGVPAQRRNDEIREQTGSRTRYAARTAVAVLAPIVLGVAVGGIAIRAVESGSRPVLPGYLTVALNGWAAGITHPVAVPSHGLTVQVRVTNSGLPTSTQWLRLRIGGTVVASRQVTVASGRVYALNVLVPALPADGCLRPVGISVGTASTVFYAKAAAKDFESAPARSVRSSTSRGRDAC